MTEEQASVGKRPRFLRTAKEKLNEHNTSGYVHIYIKHSSTYNEKIYIHPRSNSGGTEYH
jgi:hypothetical protein